jgi:uncharacterized protein
MRARWWLAALALCACSNDPAPAEPLPGEGVVLPDGTVFTRQRLLEAAGACILGELRAFDGEARALSAETDRAGRRAAWRGAVDAWQRLELMQVGPAAPSSQPAGQDLRDAIYAWPLGNACAVDQHLVDESYTSALVNARGLGAAEYLLFYAGSDNACEPSAAINAEGTWAALDAPALEARRAAYAAFVVEDVATQAGALLAAWEPSGADFAGELARAGQGSATFGKQRIAVNALSDALFYIEWATKDLKVARPAGLTGCDAATCPELVESPWALRSKEHVRSNLLAFRALFRGCGADASGIAFDDFLVAVGQAALAEELDGATLAALAAVDAIGEDDLVAALAADRASVVALHDAIKRITDLLRTQFLSLLDLELPQRVEGDND